MVSMRIYPWNFLTIAMYVYAYNFVCHAMHTLWSLGIFTKLLFCASYVCKPGAGWPQAAGMPGFSKLCLST